MPPPKKEHNAKHMTIDSYNASSNGDGLGRYEEPTPQRAAGDGSGRVVSKSPSYARNYEKTNNKAARDEPGRARM